MYGMSKKAETQQVKLTVRVPRRVLQRAKAFAQAHHTSLSRLITLYLECLPETSEGYLARATRVPRLLGTLPPSAKPEDYHRYLEEKYRGASRSD